MSRINVNILYPKKAKTAYRLWLSTFVHPYNGLLLVFASESFFLASEQLAKRGQVAFSLSKWDAIKCIFTVAL